jgi:hypothetical protein
MRSIGVLVLAAFVAGPALGGRCLLTCAAVRPSPPVPADHCHQDETSGPAFDSTEECAVPSLAVVPAAARLGVESGFAVVATVSAAMAFVVAPARPLAAPIPSGSPPGRPFLIPLRI